MLALIGEQFESVISEGDDICGLTISIRQHDDIIRLWNTNATCKNQNLLARAKEIVPSAELRSPFYKGIQRETQFTRGSATVSVVCVCVCVRERERERELRER